MDKKYGETTSQSNKSDACRTHANQQADMNGLVRLDDVVTIKTDQ